MGFPASGNEKYFRNPIDEIQKCVALPFALLALLVHRLFSLLSLFNIMLIYYIFISHNG